MREPHVIMRIVFFHERKLKILFFFFILASLFMLFKKLNYSGIFWLNIKPWPCNHSRNGQLQGKQRPDLCRSSTTKIILFYTELFQRKPWKDISTTEDFLTDCPSKKCIISYDELDIGKSDLAIFHAGDMPSWRELGLIHKYRCPHQRMAFLSHETPINSPAPEYAPNGFFNWTITYKKNSDFTIPYGHSFPVPSTTDGGTQELHTNFARGKDKFIAWAVSHCGTPREEYVKELIKHINIDIYGECGYVYGQNNICPRGSPECDGLFESYKFYLAFENCLCSDYITEKFWQTLDWGVVPIVLTKNSYEHVAPPGSFISVQDFPSVKALAQYLLYLDKNDTAYNEYFKWRQKFTTRRRDWFRFVGCSICDVLHNDCLPHQAYGNLESEFWNSKADCDEGEAALFKLITAS